MENDVIQFGNFWTKRPRDTINGTRGKPLAASVSQLTQFLSNRCLGKWAQNEPKGKNSGQLLIPDS
jgi:hypothetical protein